MGRRRSYRLMAAGSAAVSLGFAGQAVVSSEQASARIARQIALAPDELSLTYPGDKVPVPDVHRALHRRFLARDARKIRAARARARAEAAARAAAIAAAERQQQSPPSGPVPSGSPQSIAQAMMPSFGFSVASEFGCLNALWTRESGWNVYAANASGAYGIPQALPGSKMASAGADWATNPATQIKWGLGYIRAIYGTPCGAWSHEESAGWY